MGYIREPYEDLDVMSDFLNNVLASDPRTSKEYCRILIRNLLGYEVEKIHVEVQKIIGPANPDKRGIRLDIEVKELDSENSEAVVSIFDIEPHRQNDIDSHPKKARFYQAKIDSPLLKSGEKSFNHMPNLFIVSITNYDPFGEDYMLYTIKNTCVEVPEMCYDDGVVRYFFNTEGTKGGSKELKDFLNYMENSVEANITNPEIKKLSQLVHDVKTSKSERDGYMTWGDKIDGIVEEAVAVAVAEKDAEIADKDAEIANKDAEIADKDAEIANKDAEIADKDAEIARLLKLVAKQELNQD